MRPVGSCSSMPSITGGLNGAPAGRFLDVSGGVGVLSVERGGLEPCSRSRPARDAAPTIAPTIFCSDRLAADAGPGRRRSQLPYDSRPDALDAPDFVEIGAKPARTGRAVEAVEMAGVVLGYRAIWHDRGPGGRHDDQWSKSRARPPPAPNRPRPEMGRKSQSLLYNIGVLSAVCLCLSLRFERPSPSTERRASRASLALVDELTGATSMCWSWSTSCTGADLDVLGTGRRTHRR